MVGNSSVEILLTTIPGGILRMQALGQIQRQCGYDERLCGCALFRRTGLRIQRFVITAVLVFVFVLSLATAATVANENFRIAVAFIFSAG